MTGTDGGHWPNPDTGTVYVSTFRTVGPNSDYNSVAEYERENGGGPRNFSWKVDWDNNENEAKHEYPKARGVPWRVQGEKMWNKKAAYYIARREAYGQTSIRLHDDDGKFKTWAKFGREQEALADTREFDRYRDFAERETPPDGELFAGIINYASKRFKFDKKDKKRANRMSSPRKIPFPDIKGWVDRAFGGNARETRTRSRGRS